MRRRQEGLGLSESQLRERLNQLQELHILPEHRVQPGLEKRRWRRGDISLNLEERRRIGFSDALVSGS